MIFLFLFLCFCFVLFCFLFCFWFVCLFVYFLKQWCVFLFKSFYELNAGNIDHNQTENFSQTVIISLYFFSVFFQTIFFHYYFTKISPKFYFYLNIRSNIFYRSKYSNRILFYLCNVIWNQFELDKILMSLFFNSITVRNTCIKITLYQMTISDFSNISVLVDGIHINHAKRKLN